MTKAQEQDRLDRLNNISNQIRALLYDYCHEDDEATRHLERARAHIDEAWIDADGQNARTVGKLVTDIENALELFSAVAKAKPGTIFNIGNRAFIKQGEGA